MEELYIHEHALKHDLSEEQIIHAWRNAVDEVTRIRDDGKQDIVAIGPDQDGRMLELTARVYPWGYMIFHANTPPTPRTISELRL